MNNRNIRKDIIERFDKYEEDMLYAYYSFLEVHPGITYSEYINNYYKDMPELIDKTNNIKRDMFNYIYETILIGAALIYYNNIILLSQELLFASGDNETKRKLRNIISNSNEMISLYGVDRVEFINLFKITVDKNKTLKNIINKANDMSAITVDSVQTKIFKEMKKNPMKMMSLKNRYSDIDKHLKNIVDDASNDLVMNGFNNIIDSRGHNLQSGNVLGTNIDNTMHWVKLSAQGNIRGQLGLNLIKVSNHKFACPLCVPFEKKVLIDDVFQEYNGTDNTYIKLSEAIDEGLLHNHCKHSLYTVYEFDVDDDSRHIDYDIDDTKVEEYNALRRRNYHKKKYKMYNRKYVLSQDEKTRLAAYKKMNKYYENYKSIELKYGI